MPCRTFPSTLHTQEACKSKASKKPALQSRLLTEFYGFAESEIKTLQLPGKTQVGADFAIPVSGLASWAYSMDGYSPLVHFLYPEQGLSAGWHLRRLPQGQQRHRIHPQVLMIQPGQVMNNSPWPLSP